MAKPSRVIRGLNAFLLFTVPVLLPSLFTGCGDGIPDFTPEDLAEATAQVKGAYHLRDYHYGGELGEKWAAWAPDAVVLKAWTVANLANAGLVGPARKMAEGMEADFPNSSWGSLALAASRLGTSYSMDDRDPALEASKKALEGLGGLVEAAMLRAEAVSRFQPDSLDAFLETLSEEMLEHPDIRAFRADRSMPMVENPPDSAIERIVSTLEGILEEHPTHLEAALSASTFLRYYLDDVERANSLVERAAANSPSPMVHSLLWSGIMEDASLTEAERLAKVEADARGVLENAGESPARWAALASALGSSGLPDLAKEVEEMVLRRHPNTRGAEMVLGNRFQSVAREIWAAPDLNEEATARKREELGVMLREFIGREEVLDPGLLLEAKWDLFLLEHEAGDPDPDELVEAANGLVDYMETEPGPNPSTYYSIAALSLAERTEDLAAADRIIDIGLAKIEERLAEEAAEADGAGEEDEGIEAGEAGEAAGPMEGVEAEAEPSEEGGEAVVEEVVEVDPRIEAERARLLVARGVVLTKQGSFDQADDELTGIRELAEENRYASQLSYLGNLYSGQLAERRAEASEAQGADADASELLRSADEFYKEGLRGRYYGSPAQGQPWTNPNETALRSLYEKMHGDLEGFDEYLSAITDEGWEERRERVLARREEDPAPMVAFELETLDGEEITSEGLLGKVLVINFWGTW